LSIKSEPERAVETGTRHSTVPIREIAQKIGLSYHCIGRRGNRIIETAGGKSQNAIVSSIRHPQITGRIESHRPGPVD
jgi:hypothetical protein